MLKLKHYQQNALNALEQFFLLAKAEGKESAFAQVLADNGDIAVPYNDRLAGVPSVCLRVPTGGGKTLMACHSIKIASQQYVNSDSPLVLWLVPTDMIREQTLKALSNASHPYRKALQATYGDKLRICDLTSLQTLTKHDLDNACTVIVTTIQAFNITNRLIHKRTAYSFDENLSEFFTNISPQQAEFMDKVSKETLQHQPFLSKKDIGRVKHSLINFFHLYRPIVIVDEAHKNRNGKAYFATLERLNAQCLIELTATPKDNNVLYSVSAQELKSEDMIKLPIILTEHNNWQECIRDALLQRADLEILAQKENDYIRPILLIQAQDKNGDANAETVKNHLINDCHINENWIAISTGKTKELADQDLFSPDCPIRIVITVEALKEGWDCSFAYVLASLQNINSAVDVEQLLGRVLRMPYAQQRKQSELNKAYTHVISDSIAQATSQLKDRMVENMGFERYEVDRAFLAQTQNTLNLEEIENIAKTEPEVYVALPFSMTKEDFDKDLQSAMKLYKTSQGTGVTIVKGTSETVFKRIEDTALNKAKPRQQKKVQENFQNARAERRSYYAPSNWNKKFAPIAQLGLNFHDEWQYADKETIEDYINWNLLDYPVSLESFNIKETANSFVIDYQQDKKKLTYGKIDSKQLHFDEMQTTITESDLINWLDKRVRQSGITQVQMRAYLVKLISHLIHERKFSLTSLHRASFQLANAIIAEINRLSLHARKQAFQQDLFNELIVAETLTAENSFEFQAGMYPVKRPYRGGYDFTKHFYDEIDDLKEKTASGKETEEFICARLLDMHPKIKYWVRNIPKQASSFSLPTGGNDFYPDFVAELTDGKIFVLEYKGEHLKTSDDSRIKNDIGKKWATESNNLFLMAVKKDELGRGLEAQINHILQ